MRRRWTITTHATGRPRDVDVILYDKLGHMRAAASRHSNTWEPDNIGFDNAEGVCHGFQLFEIHDDGTEEEQQRTAILRFTRGHVSPEIVSHEVAHAAQHLYGLDCIETGTAKDHFDSGNETFAHLLGDLFATVWTLTQEEP